MLEEQEWTKDHLHEIAMFNIRSRSTSYKTDRVADNDFHFISTQDGYDASRILNEAFLAEMKANCKGELAVAVPHQDVLILADIQNDTGYDILAQMTMKFFAEGRSEEHTSELQSRGHLVCRLLLEKKKFTDQ